jgi:hypothetical protein
MAANNVRGCLSSSEAASHISYDQARGLLVFSHFVCLGINYGNSSHIDDFIHC